MCSMEHGLMTWSRTIIELECGCRRDGDFDAFDPGDEETCKRHGETTIKRTSRISESSGSRNFSLGTEVVAK